MIKCVKCGGSWTGKEFAPGCKHEGEAPHVLIISTVQRRGEQIYHADAYGYDAEHPLRDEAMNLALAKAKENGYQPPSTKLEAAKSVFGESLLTRVLREAVTKRQEEYEYEEHEDSFVSKAADLYSHRLRPIEWRAEMMNEAKEEYAARRGALSVLPAEVLADQARVLGVLRSGESPEQILLRHSSLLNEMARFPLEPTSVWAWADQARVPFGAARLTRFLYFQGYPCAGLASVDMLRAMEEILDPRVAGSCLMKDVDLYEQMRPFPHTKAGMRSWAMRSATVMHRLVHLVSNFDPYWESRAPAYTSYVDRLLDAVSYVGDRLPTPASMIRHDMVLVARKKAGK